MAGKLALQLVGVGLADVAEQKVVAALRGHGADAAHALAQEGQVKADEVLRDDEGDVVCCTLHNRPGRRSLAASQPGVGKHAGTGLLPYTAFAGKST